MRMEVHVHGTVLLRAGTTNSQIEEALRSWLDYIDEDNLADARACTRMSPAWCSTSGGRARSCWTGDRGAQLP